MHDHVAHLACYLPHHLEATSLGEQWNNLLETNLRGNTLEMIHSGVGSVQIIKIIGAHESGKQGETRSDPLRNV